jgi:hypothetical protein
MAYTNIQKEWNGNNTYKLQIQASCSNIETCYNCVKLFIGNKIGMRNSCINQCNLPPIGYTKSVVDTNPIEPTTNDPSLSIAVNLIPNYYITIIIFIISIFELF